MAATDLGRVNPPAQVDSRNQQDQQNQGWAARDRCTQDGIEGYQAEHGTFDRRLHARRQRLPDGAANRKAHDEGKDDQQVREEDRTVARLDP